MHNVDEEKHGMIKILFICHGNICRSPMAEFILKDMAAKIGRAGEFYIESAATTSEELGNPVYPPARRELGRHGLSCEGKYARLCTAEDYDRFDFLLGMDEENMYDLLRRYHGDPDGKIHNLLDFAGRIGEEVADPWYTGDFRTTWNDLWQGCLAFLNALNGDRTVTVDLSGCTGRKELYGVLRNSMLFEEDYGSNLDALYDILTGLPHYGSKFELLLPSHPDIADYALRVEDVFRDAGALDRGLD